MNMNKNFNQICHPSTIEPDLLVGIVLKGKSIILLE